MRSHLLISFLALLLIAACRPDNPLDDANLVVEKDTTHFKLLWQKPIANAPTDQIYIEWTPFGIVYGQLDVQKSLVCLNPVNGNENWSRNGVNEANNHIIQIGDYLMASIIFESSYPGISSWYRTTTCDTRTGATLWMETAPPVGIGSQLIPHGGRAYQAIASYHDSTTSELVLRRTLPQAPAWDTISLFQLNYNVNDIYYISEPIFCADSIQNDTLAVFTICRSIKGSGFYNDVAAVSLRSGILQWHNQKANPLAMLFGSKPYYNGRSLLTYSPTTIDKINLVDGSSIRKTIIKNPNDNLTMGGFVSYNNIWCCVTRNGKIYIDNDGWGFVEGEYISMENIHDISSKIACYKDYIYAKENSNGSIFFYDVSTWKVSHLTSPNTPRYADARILSDPVVHNDTLYCSDGYYLMCFKLKL